jgi:hypothetical protein
MLLLSTTFTYAGFHEGYQYAPGGATMGFGGHVQDVQIDAHTIGVYCQGNVGICWLIIGGDLYTGPDALKSYTPDPGGSVTLPLVYITDI